MMEPQTLAGKVTISRATNSEGADDIRIEVQDCASCTEFVALTMTLGEFAAAITGMGFQACNIDVRGLEKVGCQRELKQIAVAAVVDNDPAEIARALEPHETDGWRAMRGQADMKNRRRQTERGMQTVTFERWINPDGTPVELGDGA